MTSLVSRLLQVLAQIVRLIQLFFDDVRHRNDLSPRLTTHQMYPWCGCIDIGELVLAWYQQMSLSERGRLK